MDSVDTYWADRAALEWQVELGATEAMLDAPLNRYEVPETIAKPVAVAAKSGPPSVPAPVEVDTAAEAVIAASGAADLEGLRAALMAFEHCDLKRGARKLVFAEGDPAARVMIIGEVPTRDEDRAGKPFVGDTRVLLDNMFKAIGLETETKTYMTSVFPWPAGLEMPAAKDIAMIKPFLERHIALANPDVIVLMGNTPCQMLLGQGGLTRLRGAWAEVLGRPAMPMSHPSQLLRNPSLKKDAWADLLALKAKLES